MKTLLCIIRLKIKNTYQFRIASLSGVITQLLWGMLQIILFKAFYEANPNAFPIEFNALVAYVWFQQAFFSMLGLWNWNYEIFQKIKNGNIAYDLTKPINLQFYWFSMDIGDRISRTILKTPIIIVIALILPEPFRLYLPENSATFLAYIISITLGTILCSLLSTFIYVLTLFTIESDGLKLLYQSIGDFLIGNVIPLPFFPDILQPIIIALPFASIANTPFLIYSGTIDGDKIAIFIGIQCFWIIAIFIISKILEKLGTKNISIQGG